ncbi:MAG: ribosome maturation factor RimP [Clostridia bacterium]|nr:ribosome maturation factor RimP [Clostridia bacterium]
MKLLEQVAEIVGPKIGELGYELYDVEFRKEYGCWELLITIDAPGGVDLDACEKISRAIEPELDKADPIEQAYYLTVSSVGIDRPLKLSKDYDRNIGNILDIKLYSPPEDKALGKKKNFTAKLVSHDEETFTFETEKGGFTLPKKAAALIRPHIDF